MIDPLPPRVVGIILAAGTSSRLGRPKQLLDYRGKPLLQHVIDNARASRLDEVVLVLGANWERIETAVDCSDVHLVVNPNFSQGQSTSLIAGVNALHPGVDGVLFLLGDQPGVTAKIIDAELGAFDGNPRMIVMTDWQGTPTHPVLFGRGYFAEFHTLTGDTGAKPIIQRSREHIHLVAIDRPAPRDVDTEADYQHLLASDTAPVDPV